MSAPLPLSDTSYASLPIGEAGHSHTPVAPRPAELVRQTGFARGVKYTCGSVIHADDMDYVRSLHQPQTQTVLYQPSTCGCREEDQDANIVAPAAELDAANQILAEEVVAADDFGVASLPIGEYAVAAVPMAAKSDTELIRLTSHGGGLHTSCRDHAVHSWEMDALREAYYEAREAGVAMEQSCGCNTCGHGGHAFVLHPHNTRVFHELEGDAQELADTVDALPAEAAAATDADMAGDELDVAEEADLDGWF